MSCMTKDGLHGLNNRILKKKNVNLGSRTPNAHVIEGLYMLKIISIRRLRMKFIS